MEYLFKYSQEKVEAKDTQTSIDLAIDYMESRKEMMNKEDIIRMLIKEHAHSKGLKEFIKKEFEISNELVEIINEED